MEYSMQERIEKLEAIADELFAEGKNYLGNQLLEIVYCLEAEAAEEAEWTVGFLVDSLGNQCYKTSKDSWWN